MNYESRKASPYPGGDSWADHRERGEFGFTGLPDLAGRVLGGSVVAANDEFFASRENLIRPGRPEFTMGDFGPKGQVMDGWETRRRRGASAAEPLPGPDVHDWAVVRLGAPGIVRGVVVDTAHFRGNFAPEASVEGAVADPGDDAEPAWFPLVARTALDGHTAHGFAADRGGRYATHVRVRQYPDGGIARLRVHGEPLPDPAWLDALGTFDAAALLNGGRAVDSSDAFYSAADHMLRPGLSKNQADGWETGRRREGTRDWAVVALTAEARVRALEIETTNLVGNAPGWVSVLGGGSAEGPWEPLVADRALLPDAPHRIVPDKAAADRPVSHLRVEIAPCGGIARFRAHAELTAAGREELGRRWQRAR
ncbi:allantoicase [Mangrovactinospora gilvigrisea]|uniref:Probable allantoicase n=1 Tax=Mangrovactinospora gilvigrisea TaxID=1428644 RepID=A0A1J7BHC0_9ACTN|nr:allantoicase [Mangrovactinospora gilvigrisea]OIV37981.1 allantoicase [Mangrovactinospora gilvigrisea]